MYIGICGDHCNLKLQKNVDKEPPSFVPWSLRLGYPRSLKDKLPLHILKHHTIRADVCGPRTSMQTPAPATNDRASIHTRIVDSTGSVTHPERILRTPIILPYSVLLSTLEERLVLGSIIEYVSGASIDWRLM
ncbi:hypothetical protein AB1N83_010249 [Pleurotus pulmonarius]